MDTEGRTTGPSITFYAWDFAGQVLYRLVYAVPFMYFICRRNTLLLTSALSLKILCMFCVGGHAMRKKVLMS